MAGMEKLAIIGGGAAGLAAAVAAAREARNRGADAEVVVFERDDRVGRSILATGNGRCNFSNAQVDAGLYRNAAFVGDALLALTRQQRRGGDSVCAFFKELGLVWREESEGRLYPFANKASSELDVLRTAATASGVRTPRDTRRRARICGRAFPYTFRGRGGGTRRCGDRRSRRTGARKPRVAG